MGQVTTKLRNYEDGFFWWCPACEEMHPLPYKQGWTWDGNLETPTFTPSFKHDWYWGEERKHLICHYIMTAGKVSYCSDCTHSMAGQTIEMPDLPETLRD